MSDFSITNEGGRFTRNSRLFLTASALALVAWWPQAAMAQVNDSTPSVGEPDEVVQTQEAESAARTPGATGESDQVLEKVYVTGIRGGLGRSLDFKKNETSIVEAISAEDIGKLPDISIAESISRLPGVAAQRVNGRAQVISIRGLAPDFTTTLLNGRQQASSGDNRAVEFDQYPSELLSSVVIYKTPDAQVSGMGLSGTADLRTVRPLDFDERAVVMNLRGSKLSGDQLNADVSNSGLRFSASYIDQFANDTLGVAVGFAHLDSPSQNRHFKAYGYEAFGFAVTPDSADSALILNGQEVFAYSRENVRDAVIGIVEWAPNAQLHTTLDLYYSKFEQNETMRGAQWFSNGWADNAQFTIDETRDVGGTLFASEGTVTNIVPQLRNDYNTRDDNLFAAGINQEYQATDRLGFVADLSYSRNSRKEQVLETYAGYGLGVGGVTGSTQNVGRTFDTFGFSLPVEGYPTYTNGLNYADAAQVSLGDRAPWGGWGHDGAIRFPEVEETVKSVDLRGTYDLDGVFKNVKVGLNLTERDKSKRVDDFDLFLLNGRQQILVDPRFLVDPTSLDFAGFGDVISVNLPAALSTYYRTSPILDANFFDKNWDISEQVVTAFARSDFEIGRFTGNVGVQFVQQEQESSGTIIQGNPIVPVPVTKGADYSDVLPNLNLIYDIGGGHRLRFAASKTLARPRMDELRANITPSFGLPSTPVAPGSTLNPWSGRGGNPELEPWRATAFDLAYEWYIDSTSYVSIAGFYKDLDSYIYQQTLPFDFTGVPTPTGAVIPPGVIISPIGQMTLPANGDGGSIQGIELSGAFDFKYIHKALDGFGLIGSYSYTESDLNPTAGTNEVRIPGLSGTVYNLSAYYEKGGFQARISQRYRSAFKGEVVQLFATRGFTEILEDKQVDAQIGYNFEGGPLDGFGLQLQINNLTDSPYRTRLGLDSGGTRTASGGSLQETYEEYGREILFGINYRF
ncbi:MAG: TonB-dependent receptor [Hyphomonadaceae bacterium BRH_c29]|nr:MAG: TonB-dependent receptor [Hyphomonadaceae bacterium BRH_c29]